MSRAALLSLTLTDFRSYERATLRPDGASVYLFGANGAGKTNLLEAISLLSPGKGLRGSSLVEVGRRLPGEVGGRAWAVAAEAQSGDDGPVRLGTGVELAGAARRRRRLKEASPRWREWERMYQHRRGTPPPPASSRSTASPEPAIQGTLGPGRPGGPARAGSSAGRCWVAGRWGLVRPYPAQAMEGFLRGPWRR